MIQRLLGAQFPGRDALREQLEHARGRVIDRNGSLELKSSVSINAQVEKRVPTEGRAKDRDGMTINYLLHVVAGVMQELEVYKDDSSEVLQRPELDTIEVIILG